MKPKMSNDQLDAAIHTLALELEARAGESFGDRRIAQTYAAAATAMQVVIRCMNAVRASRTIGLP